ncbi:hypothetical protein ANACOL_01588 [Anaerotruncus colihominis DSM 17241]|uniref:Uncharacterized protein n=1 Tax=Anaerotruncus colihominis DSM 17241 TaxID=445972 RepID=B0PA19_9FIRM|nr:hypothetical protein ANACOL_01588 [Anaerotruncus colihominis DSM 17241]
MIVIFRNRFVRYAYRRRRSCGVSYFLRCGIDAGGGMEKILANTL